MESAPGRDRAPDAPSWVGRLGIPVWITTTDGVITYLNAQAESLIGHSSKACVGHSCYLVIAGRTPEGGTLCAPRCRVRRLAQGREAIAPIPMKIAAARGERRDVTLLVIPASDDQLVHCLLDASHEARLRGFIDRVARRARRGSRAGNRRHDILTTREREVLAFLAQDQSQQEIAERLGVSYTTVRNHVQHILSKLGVHSILEAVAVSLIGEE